MKTAWSGSVHDVLWIRTVKMLTGTARLMHVRGRTSLTSVH
jgi:hypothetical protein